MKRTGFALALLVFAFLPYTTFAQQMYPSYSTYETVSGNSTTIAVSVTVDGSTTGSLCNQYGCISPPTHTPSVYNSIKNNNTGAVTGGWQTGQGVTWNSYLSQTNNQSVPFSSNGSFGVSAVTQIICSAVGSFFSGGWPITVAIKVASYALATVNANGTGTYNLSCPNGNQHCTCGTAHYLGSQVHLWAEEFSLYTQPGGCFFINVVQYKDGPPAPYPCT
jgi:hypothetical protein